MNQRQQLASLCIQFVSTHVQIFPEGLRVCVQETAGRSHVKVWKKIKYVHKHAMSVLSVNYRQTRVGTIWRKTYVCYAKHPKRCTIVIRILFDIYLLKD